MLVLEGKTVEEMRRAYMIGIRLVLHLRDELLAAAGVARDRVDGDRIVRRQDA